MGRGSSANPKRASHPWSRNAPIEEDAADVVVLVLVVVLFVVRAAEGAVAVSLFGGCGGMVDLDVEVGVLLAACSRIGISETGI